MIPNNGSIPGVADDVAVEIPALVSAAGIQGLHIGNLPWSIIVHLMDLIQRMERNVQTFQSHGRGMLLDMILLNPQTRSPEDTKARLMELLALPSSYCARHEGGCVWTGRGRGWDDV